MVSFAEIAEKAKESLREFHEEINKSCNSDSFADKQFGITLATKADSICEQLVEKTIELSNITDISSKNEDMSVTKFHYSEI